MRFRTQLNICFSLIILFITISILQMLNIILKSSYRDQESMVLESQAKQIAMNIDNRLDYYQLYLNLLLKDRSLIEAMEKESYDVVCSRLKDVTEEFVHLNAGKISGINIYRSGVYNTISGLGDINQVIAKLRDKTNLNSSNIFYTDTYLNDRNEKVFSLFQKVYQTNLNRQYYVELCIYETELLGFFNKDTSGNLIAIRNNDYVMSTSSREKFTDLLHQSKKEKKIGTEYTLLEDSGAHITVAAPSKTGWEIIINTDSSYLERGFQKMNMQLIPIIALILLIAFALSRLTSAQLSHRIKILQGKIAYISRWDLDKDLRIKGKDEIKDLADELDNTRLKILDLIDQNYKANKLKRDAEMSALRSQINSHFLFNSLSSIKWLARRDDMQTLSEAVDQLVYFLRYSLSIKEDQVLLSYELQQLEAYVYLQKLCYGDAINVNIDVDEELLSCKTVKLILQPLVENAIYHGRKEDGTPLNITIYSYYDQEDYYLVVEDDGNGIPEERISDIMEGELETTRGGYGLKNVINRIRMCSGGQSELKIESKPNCYTKIIIRQSRVS